MIRGTRSLLFVVGAVAGCTQMQERFKPLAVGDPVPAYAVAVIDGDTAKVGPGLEQPLTLINVWATWCVPCQREFPDLEKIHKDYGPRGLRVLAVSVDADDDVERIREFAKTYSATFPIAHDRSGKVQDLFQAIGVPESYLISRDGRLLYRNPGSFPEGAVAIRAVIEAALAK